MKKNVLALVWAGISIVLGFHQVGHAEEEVRNPKKWWQGHKVRTDIGLFSTFNSPQASHNPGTSIGPMVELGYEYGFVFAESFYFGADATWTAFIPDSFREQNITLSDKPVSPAFLLLTPIIHFHFGYITNDNTLLTIGSAYIWGLTTTVRQPISDLFFLEAKALWFLDRIIFNVGLHDAYLSLGGGIKF